MTNNGSKRRAAAFLKENATAVIFIIIAIVCYSLSGMKFSYVLQQVVTRLGQNSFLVLALIIPIVAGMGLNFSMTVGAMTAQIGLFFVTNWYQQTGNEMFAGMSGFLIALLILIPLCFLFGFLAGKLLNKTKGQEMIAGMILGYFATGVYMFFFLIVIGVVIHIDNPFLIIKGGIGVKNTFDIPVASALDDLLSRKLSTAGPFLACLFALYFSGKINRELFKEKKHGALLTWFLFAAGTVCWLLYVLVGPKPPASFEIFYNLGHVITGVSVLLSIFRLIRFRMKNLQWGTLAGLFLAAAGIAAVQVLEYISLPSEAAMEEVKNILRIKFPLATFFCVLLLCLFNMFILKTRIGQNLRTVGQSMSVATASGINVNRVRLYAIIMSTLFAGIGQLIYLQCIGVVQTYSAHNNVALYSVAALLVGGASVTRATNRQALFGIIIFHTIMILLPNTVGKFFADTQSSEYFRAFMLYSVICFSLISYAVAMRKKRDINEQEGETDAG